MKKNVKRVISLILMLVLAMSCLDHGLYVADAASDYEEVVKWAFDSTDTYGDAWTKGGYTSSGITPTYTIADGYLKVDEDYTTATSTTYNRATAQYSFGASSQGDLSESVKLTFDYYCTEGSTPSQFMLVFTGKLQDATSNTTVSETHKFADVATKQTSSDITGYEKYSVDIELNTANATQRGYITRFQLGEIRTNNTYKGTVYYDNIVYWKEALNAPVATLSSEIATYGEEIAVNVENLTGVISYQWYKASSYDLSDAVAIEGATEAKYAPMMKDIGGYLYCVASNGTDVATTDAVRITASETWVETSIPFTTTAVSNNQWFLTNTKAYSGKFDANKLVKGGHFYVTYTGEISGVPSFQFATWSSTTGKKSVQIAASESGSSTDGTKWAKYDYSDCIAAWGDEDFSELKALRVYYNGSDNANLVVKSASWFGAPVSYGELGETVEMKGSYSSHQYLFTWHVGGTFDATRIKEDSFFYVEYKGDANALNLVCQSHSNVNSTYVTIAASESGETGSGYYSIFKASDIIATYGEDIRHLDGMRLVAATGKAITENATMYFFEGTGKLVDDIFADGYTDAIDVPWTKYDNTDKAGIAVIGASITQNPLVTALALSGAPFYAPNGGWNAILDRTDVVTYGIGSQTTVNIANRFDEVLRYDYHTIIIQCGNNDLGASSDESVVVAQEVQSYTTMYEKVAKKNQERVAAGKDPIQVYVLAINPTNSEGYSNTMQSRIENVVKALDELSANYDFVTYIDEIHEEFKNKDENGNYITGSPTNADCTEVHVNPDLVMSDGLHPVALGYAVYAKYLIPLLATTDEADATLVSLSYRFTSEEKKNSVPGFESTKAPLADGYTVLLPLETAANATVQLYITAANASSTVTVDGYEIQTDDYGNDYIEVTLADGTAQVPVEVTSPDGSVSTYTVSFGIDTNTVVFESEEEKSIVVNDSNVDSWPYTSYTVNFSGKLYTGSTLTFDVTLDNADFTKMYLEADFDWANVKSFNLTPDDFEENVYHATITYNGDTLSNLSAIQIKTGGTANTDYRGTITISNVVVNNNIPTETYRVTEGADGIWKGGSTEGLSFTITGERDAFTSISVDGVTLPSTNYSIEDDSVIVTLSSAYLETMANGTYAIEFVFADGSAETEFSVTGQQDNTGKEIEDVVIYQGEASESDAWTIIKTIQIASSDFDPSSITTDGYFTITYTGEEGKVNLALAEWTDSIWATVYPTSTVETENGFVSTYSYEDLCEAYGSIDFSGVDALSAVTAATTGETIVTEIAWHGYPAESNLGETAMLYKGSATKSAANANLTFFYTKHVGGEWDASVINEGSYFYVEYVGAKDNIYIALTSASGATNWVAVYPDETGVNADGRFYGIFSYENFSEAFGTNFARLDQIQVYTKTDAEVTLKRVAYFAGEGDPVDTSDGTWDRPTEGIAFIGDSIVQNPLVNSAQLNNIDWNGILDREDCVNYGIGGQTTKECAARIDELAKKNYDKVVMLCGINDIGRGHTNEEITTNYKTMIDALTNANPDIEVYIISVLPTTEAYYTNAQDRIVGLNEELAALTEQYSNVTYVDCHSAFVTESGYCNPDYVFDGLHPNLAGYAVIAEILNPYLEDNYVAEVDGTKYESLAEAVAAAEDGATVTLLCDAEGAGLVIDKDITIDLGGYTYTVISTVGSTGTETLGLQLLKNNDITIKNGTIKAGADDKVNTAEGNPEKLLKVLIQNYANLTLTDVKLDATECTTMLYVVSNNCGNTTFDGATSIDLAEGSSAVAFDVYDYSSAGYAVPSVSVSTTGTIEGKIEVSNTATLTISNGTYTVAVDEAWCAEGFIPKDNGNGTYGVEEGTLDKIIDNGRTLSLDGVIYINQYVKIEGFDGVDVSKNGGLLIWNSAVTEDGATYDTADVIKAGLVQSGDEYGQQTDGIAAKGYADVIYLRVYVQKADGTYVYGPLKEYSVRHYCETIIGRYEGKESALRDTCVAMLHYGAAAQEYFDYNLDDLANKNIVANYPVETWDETLLTPLATCTTDIVATGDVTDNGKTLSLDGAIWINFYFMTAGFTVESGELLVWDGVSGTLTEDNVSYTVDLVANEVEYGARSKEFAAKEYSKTIFACAKFVDTDGNVHYSDVIAYSPEAYAEGRIDKSSNAEMVEVMKRMVTYGDYARIYFESK